jgi:hypothetical protein
MKVALFYAKPLEGIACVDRFAAHPDWLDAKVGGDTTNRRFAAAVAAMAAFGDGDARTLTANEKTAWRNQAITWLHQEILAWNKRLTPRTAPQILRLLREVDDDKWLAPICAPANAGDRLAAERDAYRQLWAAAAAVSMEAFALDPALARDMTAAYRYNAACHAIRASSGAGDPRDVIDEAQRSRLRKQALAWLRAHLASWSKMAASDVAADRALVRTRLRHWQKDNDLSAIHREQAVASLPAEEPDLCRQLWHDVAEILNKTRD